MLSNLTRAYLNGDDSIRHLYNLESIPKNIIEIIHQKKITEKSNRKDLVEALSNQYSDMRVHESVTQNIYSLNKENTFTITTGHQLNLFTGPLYFIYKIISTLKTADHLNKLYSEYHFVPVYWMATEDHDFEEINHTYIANQKVQWNSSQSGMVGEFGLEDIEKVLAQLELALDNSISSKEIIDDFKKAYLNKENLSIATRTLVNSLFENFGLVIIDANNSKLKRSFSKIIEEELFSPKSYGLVSKTIKTFPDGSGAQVNPREINLFYSVDNIRERIIKNGNYFEINNTEIQFTKEEIAIELNKYPERFSPNVILRPLYQELILPNVMYIGGGAEVAYWLELKSMFDYYNVSFPLIQIRNSFVILGEKTLNKIKKSNLDWADLFLKEEVQLKMVLDNDIPFTPQMEAFRVDLEGKTNQLISEVESFDSTIIKSIEGRKAKILKELIQLEKTIFRSVKRKHAEKISMISNIRSEMFPSGVFQERRVNVVDMFRDHGRGFVNKIYEESESFDRTISILVIDEIVS
jgi:bacillithiol biosynthesis cysteine-adding enzyme BshC